MSHIDLREWWRQFEGRRKPVVRLYRHVFSRENSNEKAEFAAIGVRRLKDLERVGLLSFFESVQSGNLLGSVGDVVLSFVGVFDDDDELTPRRVGQQHHRIARFVWARKVTGLSQTNEILQDLSEQERKLANIFRRYPGKKATVWYNLCEIPPPPGLDKGQLIKWPSGRNAIRLYKQNTFELLAHE
jgi:hypothetical protein